MSSQSSQTVSITVGYATIPSPLINSFQDHFDRVSPSNLLLTSMDPLNPGSTNNIKDHHIAINSSLFSQATPLGYGLRDYKVIGHVLTTPRINLGELSLSPLTASLPGPMTC